MCCKRDTRLTKRYRAKKGWVVAWKRYQEHEEDFFATHCDKSGGQIRKKVGATEVVSDYDPKKEEDPFVRRGIHCYAFKRHADAAGMPKTKKVYIHPEDIIAVGNMWYESETGPVLDYDTENAILTIVAKKVLL
jgi:hypothetical protein